MPPGDFGAASPAGVVAVVLPPGADESDAGDAAPEAAAYFRHRLAAGAPWHRALLEAMGRWTQPEEVWRGRGYRYIIGREAFDWLLLAERLCAPECLGAAAGRIPPGELERLLFHGVLPEPVAADEFRALLGASKHQGYLNYHYGIVLEEALQLAAEEYVRKRHTARGYFDSEELVEDAFRHLYNDSRGDLFQEFSRAAGTEIIDGRRGLSLTGLKEFTYWLHKRRVNYWDPARVASDTRLAIRRLAALRETGIQ